MLTVSRRSRAMSTPVSGNAVNSGSREINAGDCNPQIAQMDADYICTSSASSADKLARVKVIRLLRPAQWLKNGFVIAPLIFSRSFVVEGAVLLSLAAFAIFCGAASAGYIVNDIIDRESD